MWVGLSNFIFESGFRVSLLSLPIVPSIESESLAQRHEFPGIMIMRACFSRIRTVRSMVAELSHLLVAFEKVTTVYSRTLNRLLG
jgi:hypothetical protein